MARKNNAEVSLLAHACAKKKLHFYYMYECVCYTCYRCNKKFAEMPPTAWRRRRHELNTNTQN